MRSASSSNPWMRRGRCGELDNAFAGGVWAVYPTGLTMIETEVLLGDDVRRFSAGVEKLLQVKVSDAQFCALVSFAFNVGISALERSTLLQVINRGHFDQVPAQPLRWTKANGKELAGLKRRRQAEANLWCNA